MLRKETKIVRFFENVLKAVIFVFVLLIYKINLLDGSTEVYKRLQGPVLFKELAV